MARRIPERDASAARRLEPTRVAFAILLGIGLVAAALVAAPSRASVALSDPPTLRPELVVPPPRADLTRFGAAVAAAGDLVATGAPRDGDDGALAGSAWIHRVSRLPDGRLVATPIARFASGMGGDRFGSSVAFSRSGSDPSPGPTHMPLLAVGADRADVDEVAAAGSVHLFAPSTSPAAARSPEGEQDWALECVLVDPSPQPAAEFGHALAIAAGARGIIAVGAPRAEVGDAIDAGKVVLFARRAWPNPIEVVAEELLAAIPVASWASGGGPRTAGASGELLWGTVDAMTDAARPSSPTASPPVASSAQSMPTSAPRGAVEVAGDASDSTAERAPHAPLSPHAEQRSAGSATWQAIAEVVSPSPSTSGWFGYSIAIDGDWIAIGEPGAPADHVGSAISGAGAVHVYECIEGLPVHRVTLRAPDPAHAAWFGLAIAIDASSEGGTLVVGSPRDRALGCPCGATYLFDLDDLPAAPRLLTPPMSQPGLGFGGAVALSGGYLAIGAAGFDAAVPGEDPSRSIEDVGTAWTYDPRSLACLARLAPGAPQPGGSFANALAVGRLDARDARDSAPIIAGGHLYVEEESTVPSAGVAFHLPPSRPDG